jgi:hypothetical protein
MEGLEFYRDERGNPCARGSDTGLARFLETDVQESSEIANALIELLRSDKNDATFNGNAHTVSLGPVLVTIECEFDDGPDRRVEREHLTNVLVDWVSFIT